MRSRPPNRPALDTVRRHKRLHRRGNGLFDGFDLFGHGCALGAQVILGSWSAARRLARDKRQATLLAQASMISTVVKPAGRLGSRVTFSDRGDYASLTGALLIGPQADAVSHTETSVSFFPAAVPHTGATIFSSSSRVSHTVPGLLGFLFTLPSPPEPEPYTTGQTQ